MNHTVKALTLPEILREDAREPFNDWELIGLAKDHNLEEPRFQEGGLFGDYVCLTYHNERVMYKFIFKKNNGSFYLDWIKEKNSRTKEERGYGVEEYIAQR